MDNNFNKIKNIVESIDAANECNKFFTSMEISSNLFIVTAWICLLVKKKALKVKFIGKVINNNPNLIEKML